MDILESRQLGRFRTGDGAAEKLQADAVMPGRREQLAERAPGPRAHGLVAFAERAQERRYAFAKAPLVRERLAEHRPERRIRHRAKRVARCEVAQRAQPHLAVAAQTLRARD